MEAIYYIDRRSGEEKKEEVYGDFFLKLLYGDGNGLFSEKVLQPFLQASVCRNSLFSSLYGFFQRTKWSKHHIQPFIDKYKIDVSEFQEPVELFSSFNDFFVRKLKPTARPLAEEKNGAIMPADGRYLFFPDISQENGFFVKGKKFSLEKLVDNKELAEEYQNGSMVFARLCPTDYHRYHFPFDCTVGKSRLINGYLYSVNPIALKKNIEIFTENKRVLTELISPEFGKVLFIEVGATCVGSIHQTYPKKDFYLKGEEKGFFSFGGSSLILLFLPHRIIFDTDLIEKRKRGLEIYCLMGQSMGRS